MGDISVGDKGGDRGWYTGRRPTRPRTDCTPTPGRCAAARGVGDTSSDGPTHRRVAGRVVEGTLLVPPRLLAHVSLAWVAAVSGFSVCWWGRHGELPVAPPLLRTLLGTSAATAAEGIPGVGVHGDGG